MSQGTIGINRCPGQLQHRMGAAALVLQGYSAGRRPYHLYSELAQEIQESTVTNSL